MRQVSAKDIAVAPRETEPSEESACDSRWTKANVEAIPG